MHTYEFRMEVPLGESSSSALYLSVLSNDCSLEITEAVQLRRSLHRLLQ